MALLNRGKQIRGQVRTGSGQSKMLEFINMVRKQNSFLGLEHHFRYEKWVSEVERIYGSG